MAKSWFIALSLMLCVPFAHAQPRVERVAEAFAEVRLNSGGCDWTLRSIFGTDEPPEQAYYDYEYDAFERAAFVLKYLGAPVRLGLTWSDEQLSWETSLQTSHVLKEAHGLRAVMEEHDVFRQRLESTQVESLLESTIRFFEVMEEWDGGGRPPRPDPRFRHWASRVDAFMDRWDWPAKSTVFARLNGHSTSWAPAAFHHGRESEMQTLFIDATPAKLTLIRKETRDQHGLWSVTCRLRAEPVGGLGVRSLDDFAEQYLRFLSTYGFGGDLLSDDDPDPFPYTAAWLSQGQPEDQRP